MATIEELKAELEQLNQAIRAAIGGRRVKVESGNVSREIERQSLSVLYTRKRELEFAISRKEGRGSVSVGVPRP